MFLNDFPLLDHQFLQVRLFKVFLDSLCGAEEFGCHDSQIMQGAFIYYNILFILEVQADFCGQMPPLFAMVRDHSIHGMAT